jgi:hypothetical protein
MARSDTLSVRDSNVYSRTPDRMEVELDFRPYQVGIVIGGDHKIQQLVQGVAPSDPRNTLRLRYLDFLRDFTRRYPVDVLCEEAKHGVESIAETVADQERLRYRNLEPPTQRRAELGIPALYTIDVPVSEVSEEQKAQWTALWESHMVQELLGAVAGARAMIVICGVLHMPAMIQVLSTKFTRVEQCDVTATPWFDRSLL